MWAKLCIAVALFVCRCRSLCGPDVTYTVPWPDAMCTVPLMCCLVMWVDFPVQARVQERGNVSSFVTTPEDRKSDIKIPKRVGMCVNLGQPRGPGTGIPAYGYLEVCVRVPDVLFKLDPTVYSIKKHKKGIEPEKSIKKTQLKKVWGKKR